MSSPSVVVAKPARTATPPSVRVSVPVFQGFRRDARIDQKRAALRQAETQRELVTDQATTQIRALADQADEARVRVQWPDGEVGPWLSVAADRFVTIERGASERGASEATEWSPIG